MKHINIINHVNKGVILSGTDDVIPQEGRLLFVGGERHKVLQVDYHYESNGFVLSHVNVFVVRKPND